MKVHEQRERGSRGDSLAVVVQQRTKLSNERVATDAAKTINNNQQKHIQPTVTRNFDKTPEHSRLLIMCPHDYT